MNILSERLKGELLGCVLSDGTLQEKHRYRVGFHIGEKKFADYISYLIQQIHNKKPVYFTSLNKKYNKDTYHIRLNGFEYYNHYNKQYHNFITTYPKTINDFEKGILQGYFYGNGCLYQCKYKNSDKIYKFLKFTDADRNIIKSIEYRLKLLGITDARYRDTKTFSDIVYNKQDIVNKFMNLFNQKFWKEKIA